MIYLNNNTEPQEVWIRRNDGLGYIHTGSSSSYLEGFEAGKTYQKGLMVSTAFTENGNYRRENGWSLVTVNVPTGSTARLEKRNVTISADTTNVVPRPGFDGMSEVTIDATDFANENYEAGVDDGFTDGYSSGYTEGVNDEKAKLSATTFTANTAVTISDGGYSAITVNVPQTGSSIPLSSITIIENTAITETEKAYSAITVNVPQTGHTDQELEDAYNSGYTSGETHQKSLLSSTAFTENGSYQRENGWSGITVNIDTASTYSSGYTSGYTSGHTDGMKEQKELLSSTAITENGSYSSENGFSSVTVNVDTASTYNDGYESGYTDGEQTIIDTFTSTTVTINGVYGSTANPLSSITVNVPQTGQSVTLEEANVTISADTTVVNPSQGYDGLSKVNIDATDYGNSKYNSGYTSGYTSGNTDGYDSGYTSGYSSGYTSGYSSGYTSGYTDGYDSGYTSGNTDGFDSGYTSGYTSGETAGFNIGYTSGETDVISTFISTAVTENGVYGSSANPYSSITVNVDTASTYNSGYTSGVTDGENNIVSTFSSDTITVNGVYGDSAHPYSSITVNVPQSGVVIDLNKEYIERTITAITIPSSCTIVGRAAFSFCEQARTIEIPNTVTSAFTGAFSHCHRVTAITFGENIEYIGPYAFEDCGNLLVPPQSINNGHIILPDSVKKVDYDAFNGISVTVTAITFGSGTVKLYNDILMSTNIQEIYCYATTAPERQVNIISGTFDGEGPRYEYWTFRGIQSTGTVHYPAGSDYSSWQNDVYLSGWTFIADL